jgi:hypothetical protein
MEKLLKNVDWNVEDFLVFLSVFFVTTTITASNTSIPTIVTLSFLFLSIVYFPAIMNYLVSGTVEYSRDFSEFSLIFVENPEKRQLRGSVRCCTQS